MLIAFQLALKNVYRKRERSFLTIIGVLLAVGSFISLLSIAEGLYNRIYREVNDRYVDIYILPGDAATLPTGPLGTVGFSSSVIPIGVKDKLEKFGDVKNVCPIYRLQQNIGGQTIIIWGINPDKFPLFFPYFKLQRGSRMYMPKEHEIVVGGALAREKNIHLQTPLVIEGVPFNTVGIGIPVGAFQDYFCYVSLEDAMQIKNAKGYQEIWLQMESRNSWEHKKAAEALKKMFPNLKVLTRKEYLGSANEYVNYAWLLQFAIAAIGALIAMSAAMNTMLMSTYERMKEFGTLRSIGASRLTVFMMILWESLILCMVGGLGGIVLGVMGSRVLDEAVQVLLQISFPLAKITFPLIIYAVILSITIGFVGAIIPAVLIYRMNIVDALRWE